MTNSTLLTILFAIDIAAMLIMLYHFEDLLFLGATPIKRRERPSTLASVIPEERFGRPKKMSEYDAYYALKNTYDR